MRSNLEAAQQHVAEHIHLRNAVWGVSAMPVPCLSMKAVAVVALVAVVPVGVVVTVVVVMVYHPAAAGNATCPSPMTQP